MRMGGGVEYVLPLNFPLTLTLYANYMHGFSSTDEISVTNTVSEIPSASIINYNGSGWSLDLGVKIPLRFNEDGICAPLPERQ